MNECLGALCRGLLKHVVVEQAVQVRVRVGGGAA